MLGNFKKVFGEPPTWDNLPVVEIDENNLNEFSKIKQTAESISLVNAYTEQRPLTYDNIFEEVMKRLAVKPTFKHQCNNCGGVLEMDADNHIFHCPYCNTVYAVGIANIMAR